MRNRACPPAGEPMRERAGGQRCPSMIGLGAQTRCKETRPCNHSHTAENRRCTHIHGIRFTRTHHSGTCLLFKSAYGRMRHLPTSAYFRGTSPFPRQAPCCTMNVLSRWSALAHTLCTLCRRPPRRARSGPSLPSTLRARSKRLARARVPSRWRARRRLLRVARWRRREGTDVRPRASRLLRDIENGLAPGAPLYEQLG